MTSNPHPEEGLKRCPFCGGEAFIIEDRGENRSLPLLYRPQCCKCGADRGGLSRKAEAIAAWNTRAEASSDLVEALEGAFMLADWAARRERALAEGHDWQVWDRNIREWTAMAQAAAREAKGLSHDR